MSKTTTEQQYSAEESLDVVPSHVACSTMISAQKSAVDSVSEVVSDLEKAAVLQAQTITQGGRLIYAAAGSSGLMALCDAAELPGTFGIDPQQIIVLMAGGVPQGSHMPGATEDSVVDLAKEVENISSQDCVIALSASGSTPYPLEIARQAMQKNVPVIAITNNSNSPIADSSTISITLQTPPEALAGSTRLGASTAQKVALNVCSTLAGIMMGHVHDGMMVNLLADNAKLKKRAQGIVAYIASVSQDNAASALQVANGQTKPAILVAKGATIKMANELLNEHKGFLRPCLKALS